MTEKLEEYILDHIDKEDDYLYDLYRATNLHLLYGRMVSGNLQGQLLKMLVSVSHPKNILEIGTFSGYSAISLARGLDEGGRLFTFEINDELEDFTRQWIDNSDVADRIDFRIGDALIEAPKLGVKFDMVFIDGDKRKYPNYYRMLLPEDNMDEGLLNSGGLIIADNTLWDGHVVEPEYDNDKQTIGIKTFNDIVANDVRVEKVILPLRDGLTIIRYKG